MLFKAIKIVFALAAIIAQLMLAAGDRCDEFKAHYINFPQSKCCGLVKKEGKAGDKNYYQWAADMIASIEGSDCNADSGEVASLASRCKLSVLNSLLDTQIKEYLERCGTASYWDGQLATVKPTYDLYDLFTKDIIKNARQNSKIYTVHKTPWVTKIYELEEQEVNQLVDKAALGLAAKANDEDVIQPYKAFMDQYYLVMINFTEALSRVEDGEEYFSRVSDKFKDYYQGWRICSYITHKILQTFAMRALDKVKKKN